MRAGRCAYRRSVTIAASKEGLYLATKLFSGPIIRRFLCLQQAVMGCEVKELARGPVIEITIEAYPVPATLQLARQLAERLQISSYIGFFSPPS